MLQVNIRPGEFAQAGVSGTPLLILGNVDPLHVRVDIDENDAWRFRKGGKAVAFLRGNRNFSTELTLAYVEPYVVPKRSLTGDSTERVDTRVLQVLYSFDRSKLAGLRRPADGRVHRGAGLTKIRSSKIAAPVTGNPS